MSNPVQDFKSFTTNDIISRLPENIRECLRKNLVPKLRSGKPLRVYCDGVFDMFHFGHMRMLKQIKDMIPNVYLVVGVCSDIDIETNKGSHIMNNDERIESVKHCKWVDEIYYPAPWSPDVEFLCSQSFDFVAHDVAPYAADGSGDVYAEIKSMGMFLPTLRTEGISTSDLMARILHERTDIMIRNLSKGVKRKDMNINGVEYFYLNVKKNYRRLKKAFSGAKNRVKRTMIRSFGRNRKVSKDDEEILNMKLD